MHRLSYSTYDIRALTHTHTQVKAAYTVGSKEGRPELPAVTTEDDPAGVDDRDDDVEAPVVPVDREVSVDEGLCT